MAKFQPLGSQQVGTQDAAVDETGLSQEFELPVFINTHLDPDMKVLESVMLEAIRSGGEGGWPCEIEGVSIGEVVEDEDTTAEYHMEDGIDQRQASWRSTAYITTTQPVDERDIQRAASIFEAAPGRLEDPIISMRLWD